MVAQKSTLPRLGRHARVEGRPRPRSPLHVSKLKSIGVPLNASAPSKCGNAMARAESSCFMSLGNILSKCSPYAKGRDGEDEGGWIGLLRLRALTGVA
ncbi:hypothetical protein MUK42_35219 [Musa troglodytarum]|uniref:Uncharacterized protein n=1 Tax=Musa troglodytarum TaxID=320322 RepID=A0A9E7K8Z5_9LILI|nr:hypothetical protein MUK42_35219 [Musa troglodytarum]